MIRNYLKIAFRNLTRNSGYSIINIGGLAVGMAVALLIGLWVNDELTYNQYHPEHARVAQVWQQQLFNGYTHTQTAIPHPLGNEIRKLYGDDFKYVAMSSWTGEHILSYKTNSFSKRGNYMEPDAPRLLSLKMLKGSLDGLKQPGSILLSQSVARAMFGDKDPMNELMQIDNYQDVKVTGVYEDFPFNAEFKEMSFIAPWELYVNSMPWVKNARDQWGNNSFQLFVQIADKADMKTVGEKIANVKYNAVEEEEKIFKAKMFLHPMTDWHLHSNWEDGVQTGGLIDYIWLFGPIGGFVLLLACINFMNLSTARSEQRAKEVGIRKSIGSIRRQLVQQFLSESLLVVIFAFILAMTFVTMVLPLFNELADKRMVMPLGNLWFWAICIAFILITGLLAGSYPALYLSSFQPVKVLKGSVNVGRRASLPRKILVVTQFTVSITLIIGTLIVYQQIQFTKARPLGFEREGRIMIEIKSPDFHSKFDVLRNELKQSGFVEEVAESSSPVTAVWSNNGGFNWEGKDPALQPDFATIWISHEYGSTVGWKIVEGRDFSHDFISDSSAVIINEAAVKFMGVDDPIGMTIRWGDEKDGEDFKVIGIVADLMTGSPFRDVKQGIYILNKNNENWVILKFDPAKSTSEALAGVEKIFKRNLPAVPFDYQFLDQAHAKKFATEERIGTLAGIFAVLAVFISCLGLLGLASFVAAQRTKEIGIRKVLGASVTTLWGMLSKDFVILVIIACLIAIPISYYFTSHWLKGYEYKTTISWWIFGATSIGALVITLLMVSFQAIKVALTNPVKSLRSE